MLRSIVPRLRAHLDVFPSSRPDQPGLVLRDPYRYTDAVLLVPPAVAASLECFDGTHTMRELQTTLSKNAGRPLLAVEVERFVATLKSQGFLEGAEFNEIRRAKRDAFTRAKARASAHAGSGYPDNPQHIDETFDEYYTKNNVTRDGRQKSSLIGIAAPHVSPFGGAQAYASAYAKVGTALRDKTFVILGTSHYGDPQRFGLTKKPFITPYGRADVDVAAVDALASAAPSSVIMEDYCHSIEHSIEFQVVFLQHAVKAPIRVLPILVGPFATREGNKPESQPNIAAFFAALRALVASRGSELFWVLGIDLAHVGARYGDDFAASADRGRMSTVAKLDDRRLGRVLAGDADGFYDLAHCATDDLRWCGTAPIYTFLKAVDRVRGARTHYQQWNIDPKSVVSFAGLELHQD